MRKIVKSKTTHDWSCKSYKSEKIRGEMSEMIHEKLDLWIFFKIKYS